MTIFPEKMEWLSARGRVRSGDAEPEQHFEDPRVRGH
jgi:hypothetical protein